MNENVLNGTPQTVVESAPTIATDNSGMDAGTPADNANSGAAPRNQSKSENSAAAGMRRKYEAAQKEHQALLDGLSKYGYSGATAQEILDQLEAKQTGSTVEQIRQSRAKAQKAVQDDPMYQDMLKKNIEYGKAEDLRQIQAVDSSVKSVDELGDNYFKLRAAGIDAMTAYRAIKGASAPTTPKPADIGPISDGGSAEDEYYTSEQLDRLTDKDLDNPKIFKKAMASLSRLGKK